MMMPGISAAGLHPHEESVISSHRISVQTFKSNARGQGLPWKLGGSRNEKSTLSQNDPRHARRQAGFRAQPFADPSRCIYTRRLGNGVRNKDELTQINFTG